MLSIHLPRFYPILDTAALRRIGLDPIELCHALLGSGARILQFRHKGEWDRETFALAERLANLVRDADAIFIVNDRADVALVVGAAGVHLGQTDLRPSAVRSFAGDRLLIGWSTHNEAQLREAASEPAD